MILYGAACDGADFLLFDATSGQRADDALSYCERCIVTSECETLVNPRKSYFDGVCAGRIWHNGRPVDPGLF